ncbi:reverse transcriptase domain-containing protein [Tanacetum coccineum]
MADFIVERPKDDSPDTPIEAEEDLPDPWTLFTDGSSCVDGSGAGLILTDPGVAEFTYALRFKFDATNNDAKYEALLAGLRIAEQMGVKNLQASVDSHLVANQVNESYIAKEPVIILYLEKVKTLSDSFKIFSIKQHARRNKIRGSKGNTNKILLAHNAYGCKKTDPGMSGLPANRLVERANRSLGEGIKAQLDERSKDWIKKVPHVFWAHRGMIKLSNEDTPFSLTCITEALIPVEIGMPTFRTAKIDIV